MSEPATVRPVSDVPALSVVVPIYNERDNIRPLVARLIECIEPMRTPYEFVLVDDGSTDGSAEELDAVAAADPHVRVIHFVRNYGQAAAMAAGFEAARGAVIITADGDRQNEPADIPALVARLEEGFDLVSGWRRDRQDSVLRRFPSRVANRLIGWVTGVRLHDYGCTLKAYRRGFVEPGELIGEMHRFLPVFVAMKGGRITEMVVRHHPRSAGRSKYGLGRTFRVCLDLLLVRILQQYPGRPSHLFVKPAALMSVGGGVLMLAGIAGLADPGWRFAGASLVLGGIVLFVGGAVLAGLGLVAELVVRGWIEARPARPYRVRRTIGPGFRGAGGADADRGGAAIERVFPGGYHDDSRTGTGRPRADGGP